MLHLTPAEVTEHIVSCVEVLAELGGVTCLDVLRAFVEGEERLATTDTRSSAPPVAEERATATGLSVPPTEPGRPELHPCGATGCSGHLSPKFRCLATGAENWSDEDMARTVEFLDPPDSQVHSEGRCGCTAAVDELRRGRAEAPAEPGRPISHHDGPDGVWCKWSGCVSRTGSCPEGHELPGYVVETTAPATSVLSDPPAETGRPDDASARAVAQYLAEEAHLDAVDRDLAAEGDEPFGDRQARLAELVDYLSPDDMTEPDEPVGNLTGGNYHESAVQAALGRAKAELLANTTLIDPAGSAVTR